MKPTLALLTALLLIPLVGGATCYAAAGAMTSLTG